MGSFVALSMLGLFPNPGQNVYLIIPPYFESVSVKNGVTGNTATITNVNFDAAYENIYIQNATLDGVPYTKNWIGKSCAYLNTATVVLTLLDHSFFTEGKTLVLELGNTESAWGSAAEDLPPSLSTM